MLCITSTLPFLVKVALLSLNNGLGVCQSSFQVLDIIPQVRNIILLLLNQFSLGLYLSFIPVGVSNLSATDVLPPSGIEPSVRTGLSLVSVRSGDTFVLVTVVALTVALFPVIVTTFAADEAAVLPYP